MALDVAGEKIYLVLHKCVHPWLSLCYNPASPSALIWHVISYLVFLPLVRVCSRVSPHYGQSVGSECNSECNSDFHPQPHFLQLRPPWPLLLRSSPLTPCASPACLPASPTLPRCSKVFFHPLPAHPPPQSLAYAAPSPGPLLQWLLCLRAQLEQQFYRDLLTPQPIYPALEFLLMLSFE